MAPEEKFKWAANKSAYPRDMGSGSPGMTMREAYALAAMQGSLAAEGQELWPAADIAERAFRIADAMIAESLK